jgi:hypothetical protein
MWSCRPVQRAGMGIPGSMAGGGIGSRVRVIV